MLDDDDDRKDDFEEDEDATGFEGVYIVDEDTARLLEVVVGMIHMLGNTQVDEAARDNCFVIAQELAERFGVPDDEIEVEEIIHGDEVLYKPRGGVMGDEPIPEDDEPEEGEAPAVDAE
jgi:hypothetical protein